MKNILWKRMVGVLLALGLLAASIPIAAAVSAATVTVQTKHCDLGAYYGGYFDIEVYATGTDLSYQWQAFGLSNWLDLSDNEFYSGTKTNHMRLSSINFENGSTDWNTLQFRCFVKGKEGTAASPEYHMVFYSLNDLRNRITEEDLHFASASPAQTPDSSVTKLTAEKGSSMDFSFSPNEFPQWLKDTEASVKCYITVVKPDGMGKRVNAQTTKVTFDQGGQYQVTMMMDLYVGENRANYAVSHKYMINVKTPLAITSQPQSVGAEKGEEATISITAEGDGLTYQWQKLSESPRSPGWYDIAGETGTTLTVSGERGTYRYHCIVRDQYGNSVTSDTATLTVSVFQKGDLDANGIVNMADAFLLYRAASGQVTLTEAQQARGDMDGNGTINMADAFALYRQVSGGE
ncbi:MAG: hypothetical protein IJU16_06210 [Clostridia bacterium]|nr:hypothetical protein [Clostridia bacterium]